MGLTVTDIELLLDLRDAGFRPQRVATIGRMSLLLHPSQQRRLADHITRKEVLQHCSWGAYAEPLLAEITGASEVISLDNSDYEGANLIHDMNLPIPASRPDLIDGFDLVIDGGTLEHVFNFPVAIDNMAALCRVGGYILSANPANNLCGHGLYQLSPELLYRIYSEQNGFDIQTVLLTVCKALSVERDRHPKSYRVPDPARLGRRIFVRNRHPVMIRCLAKKVASRPPGALSVQQSDYVAVWGASHTGRHAEGASIRALRTLLNALPDRLQTLAIDRAATRDHGPRWKGRLS